MKGSPYFITNEKKDLKATNRIFVTTLKKFRLLCIGGNSNAAL
jgi:hypothetical protein